MKRMLFLLCISGFIACSNDKTASTAGTTSDPDTGSPIATPPTSQPSSQPQALTDKEKAKITDEFLVLNARQIRNLQSDDCDQVIKSLQLLYARQILSTRFNDDIPASSDIGQLVQLLENKMTVLTCSATLGGDITFGISTSGGQVAFMKKMPVTMAMWAVLNDDQRGMILQGVPPETKAQLLTLESKYAEDIHQIKEVPRVKTIIRPASIERVQQIQRTQPR